MKQLNCFMWEATVQHILPSNNVGLPKKLITKTKQDEHMPENTKCKTTNLRNYLYASSYSYML